MLSSSEAKVIAAGPSEEARADFSLRKVPGVTVSGRLIGPDPSAKWHDATELGLYAQGPRISLGGSQRAATSSARFEIHNVLPGKYRLVAITREIGGPRTPLGGNQEIEVGDKGREGIELKMQPLQDVPGTVVFGAGCPSGPVRIGTVIASPLTRLFGKSETPTTAADGSFVIHAVRPGEIRLNAIMPPQFTAYPIEVTMTLNGGVLPDKILLYPPPPGAALRIDIKCYATPTR